MHLRATSMGASSCRPSGRKSANDPAGTNVSVFEKKKNTIDEYVVLTEFCCVTCVLIWIAIISEISSSPIFFNHPPSMISVFATKWGKPPFPTHRFPMIVYSYESQCASYSKCISIIGPIRRCSIIGSIGSIVRACDMTHTPLDAFEIWLIHFKYDAFQIRSCLKYADAFKYDHIWNATHTHTHVHKFEMLMHFIFDDAFRKCQCWCISNMIIDWCISNMYWNTDAFHICISKYWCNSHVYWFHPAVSSSMCVRVWERGGGTRGGGRERLWERDRMFGRELHHTQ